MLYPNNIKKTSQKSINYANRGMELESLIEEANNYYLSNDLAIIYKKPTPVKIMNVTFQNNKSYVSGYLDHKSTLDYVGIYKGKYIDFDAKMTKKSDAFPLSNIHKHQIEHIKRIINHKGISFLIIEMNNNCFILLGETLIDFLKNSNRKSIPYDYILKNAYQINLKYNPVLDYLEVIDNIYFKGENNEKD